MPSAACRAGRGSAQLLDPRHVLAGDRSLFPDFGLQRRGSPAVAAELLLGLLEQLLVALQDTALLAVRLEKLVQVLAQAGPARARVRGRPGPRPGVRRQDRRPPPRPR